MMAKKQYTIWGRNPKTLRLQLFTAYGKRDLNALIKKLQKEGYKSIGVHEDND